MTREEFEAQYARRSGMTAERLHELGCHGEPCDANCDDETCQGWQMVSHPTSAEIVATAEALHWGGAG